MIWHFGELETINPSTLVQTEQLTMRVHFSQEIVN